MHEDQLRGDCDKKMIRTSLVNQWLRLCTSNTGAWVPSLVRELRSHLPQLRVYMLQLKKRS